MSRKIPFCDFVTSRSSHKDWDLIFFSLEYNGQNLLIFSDGRISWLHPTHQRQIAATYSLALSKDNGVVLVSVSEYYGQGSFSTITMVTRAFAL